MSYGAVVLISVVLLGIVLLAMNAAKGEHDERAADELGLEFIGDDPGLGATIGELVGIGRQGRAEQLVALSGIRC